VTAIGTSTYCRKSALHSGAEIRLRQGSGPVDG